MSQQVDWNAITRGMSEWALQAQAEYDANISQCARQNLVTQLNRKSVVGGGLRGLVKMPQMNGLDVKPIMTQLGSL